MFYKLFLWVHTILTKTTETQKNVQKHTKLDLLRKRVYKSHIKILFHHFGGISRVNPFVPQKQQRLFSIFPNSKPRFFLQKQTQILHTLVL